MTDVRRAAVAGMFYPADAGELHGMVDGMLAEVEVAASPARAAIAPHAGLVYSGQCAAHVWGRIAIPSTVVILAPNHTGLVGHPGGASTWNRGRFATPLGDVPVAEEFVAHLEAATDLVRDDRVAHLREHAIEVELPFLRALAPEVSLVPIVLAWAEWGRARALGAALADTVEAFHEDVLLVASSDMTHYESASRAAAQDRLALEAVEAIDGERLLEVCRREEVTMCGRGPAAVVLEAARRLGATTAEVVDYRHSGWVTGDDSSVVAYAGVVVN